MTPELDCRVFAGSNPSQTTEILKYDNGLNETGPAKAAQAFNLGPPLLCMFKIIQVWEVWKGSTVRIP